MISVLGSRQVDRRIKAEQRTQCDSQDSESRRMQRIHRGVTFEKPFRARCEVERFVIGWGIVAREPEQHGEQSEQCKGRCCAGPFCSETKESQAVTDKDGEPGQERILTLYWSQPSRFARCDDMI